ncbi:hypothetical protein VFPPC_17715 [Pochonia chlamydosporia 170]|uniref:Uncharacterized protein n=1 Tax=Pochonia chlamydosporia 170 TaxID=1380566 RepID=A0A219AR77_METCM|nr:hypothetical protein VFPPC_17715 [Pochonia chlamydosporia 170]OWT43109.1 hypothetical protein VFPPC_17715 [Pochonia chlamydosporia 170]
MFGMLVQSSGQRAPLYAINGRRWKGPQAVAKKRMLQLTHSCRSTDGWDTIRYEKRGPHFGLVQGWANATRLCKVVRAATLFDGNIEKNGRAEMTKVGRAASHVITLRLVKAQTLGLSASFRQSFHLRGVCG